ncbi:MAG: hypothetical protein HY540_08525 [Deltaproteobacteria bacterium]|nr:hypothetical protein [Deltaproteobacteria bacterium]
MVMVQALPTTNFAISLSGVPQFAAGIGYRSSPQEMLTAAMNLRGLGTQLSDYGASRGEYSGHNPEYPRITTREGGFFGSLQVNYDRDSSRSFEGVEISLSFELPGIAVSQALFLSAKKEKGVVIAESVRAIALNDIISGRSTFRKVAPELTPLGRLFGSVGLGAITRRDFDLVAQEVGAHEQDPLRGQDPDAHVLMRKLVSKQSLLHPTGGSMVTFFPLASVSLIRTPWRGRKISIETAFNVGRENQFPSIFKSLLKSAALMSDGEMPLVDVEMEGIES